MANLPSLRIPNPKRTLHLLIPSIVASLFALTLLLNFIPRTIREEEIPHQNPKLSRNSTQNSPFFASAADFFNGYSCNLRFFITWISKPQPFAPREQISIESLFHSHPNACLLIVSDTLNSSKFLTPFLKKGFRVGVSPPNFDLLLKNTPAERWFAGIGKQGFDAGKVPVGQNLSNLLRLVLLYEFGGIYIDTDVIILKNLAGLRNAIGSQADDGETGHWIRLNNAVLIFDRGHPLLFEFIAEFAKGFDGNKWGHNGPYLVSRVASRVAGRAGFEFSVLPPPAFYPVDWNRIGGLFEGPRDRRHAKWVAAKVEGIRKGSYALHLWNRQSRGYRVEEGSVIGRIVLDCCVLCNHHLEAL